jgi:LysR family transcriptional regulator, nitrogen assimilation regulatory protein
MEFRRIRHFVHIAELGSLSKAAERLHVVQPALSQSIKHLEEELGAKLFRRSRRGMELTEAGRMFLDSAYGILNQCNRAKENISAIGNNPKGLVSVAMTASAMHVLSLPICSALQRRYAGITLNIEEGLAANIQQSLEAGWYDLMVSYMAKTEDSFHVEELIEEDLYLASAYHDRADTSDLDFRDLRSFLLVLPQGQHGVGGSINATAAECGITLNIAQVSAALHPTLQLVEAGHGHSLMPWSAIYDRVEQKKIVARKVVRPTLCHTVRMIYPSHRPLTQATIAVMEILRISVRAMHAERKWPGRLLIKENPANFRTSVSGPS